MFFDSVDGEDERYYTADEFADYFRRFIRNGIFNGSGDNLQVGAQGQDMRTFIKPGYAWIEGYLYKIDIEPLELYHPMAHASLDRIDRVVIRLDKTLENRYVKAFVLTGTPAETPQVSELTRDEMFMSWLSPGEAWPGKVFERTKSHERLNPKFAAWSPIYLSRWTPPNLQRMAVIPKRQKSTRDTGLPPGECLADKSRMPVTCLAMLTKFTAFQISG